MAEVKRLLAHLAAPGLALTSLSGPLLHRTGAPRGNLAAGAVLATNTDRSRGTEHLSHEITFQKKF